MVGYDFDKTLYDGDSFTHFYFFVLSRCPYLVVLLPFQLLCMAFVFKSRKMVKSILAFSLRFVPNKELLVIKFWQKYAERLKFPLVKNLQPCDVIISASPEFLLAPICKVLGVTNLICTNMNIKNGKISGNNCYGAEKVVRFKCQFGEKRLVAFYSDSASDFPLKQVADKFYLVKGTACTQVQIEN